MRRIHPTLLLDSGGLLPIFGILWAGWLHLSLPVASSLGFVWVQISLVMRMSVIPDCRPTIFSRTSHFEVMWDGISTSEFLGSIAQPTAAGLFTTIQVVVQVFPLQKGLPQTPNPKRFFLSHQSLCRSALLYLLHTVITTRNYPIHQLGFGLPLHTIM